MESTGNWCFISRNEDTYTHQAAHFDYLDQLARGWSVLELPECWRFQAFEDVLPNHVVFDVVIVGSAFGYFVRTWELCQTAFSKD